MKFHPDEHLTGHAPSLLSELADLGLRSFDPTSLSNWDPALIQKFLPRVAEVRDRYYHGTVLGLDKLPEGPFMLVGSHGGGPMTVLADNLVLFSSYYEATGVSRPLYGITHHIAFHLGPIGRVMAKWGGVDGTPATARKILRSGFGLVVYPGGEEDMSRTYWERNRIDFRGHAGFARLAVEEQVPVFPLAEIGGHETEFVLTPGHKIAKALRLPQLVGLKTFPVALTIPWGVTVGYWPYIPLPSRITMKIGDPLTFATGSNPKHAAEKVEKAVQRLTLELVAEFEALGVPAR